jgi:hypothetical protein
MITAIIREATGLGFLVTGAGEGGLTAAGKELGSRGTGIGGKLLGVISAKGTNGKKADRMVLPFF